MKAIATIKRNSILTISGLVIASSCLLMTSCREEVGCTNRRSDNYNPDAIKDDGSCVNARDKFLGVYSTLQICWPDTMLPLPRYLTIAEDDLREEEDDVKILNFGEDSITVRALISQHAMTLPMQNLSVRGVPMTFKGEGHIDDDGYLTILYSIWLVNTGQLIKEDCVIFAQRLDN